MSDKDFAGAVLEKNALEVGLAKNRGRAIEKMLQEHTGMREDDRRFLEMEKRRNEIEIEFRTRIFGGDETPGEMLGRLQREATVDTLDRVEMELKTAVIGQIVAEMMLISKVMS